MKQGIGNRDRSSIFDDSSEHDAWNDSAEERVVLIFETWNPYVYQHERFGIERFFQYPPRMDGPFW